MSTQLTPEQIEIKIRQLETKIKAFQVTLERLQADINNKISSSDLSRTNNELRGLIQDNSKLINNNVEKLSKVILPEETRFYLEGSEVQDFQSNFNKLKAMMVNFEKLYKNLVSYATNLNS